LIAAVFVLIIVAAALGHRQLGTGSGPPVKPPAAGIEVGVNVNRLFNDRDHTPRQIAAQLAALRATGARLARSDAQWEASEPTAPTRGAHRYDWRFDDEVAASLAAQGLRWLPIVDYSALWAQSIAGEDHSPPRSFSLYADYAAALAARYGAGGTFWRAHPELTPQPVSTFEIWNEPDNTSFWKPGPNPAAYAALYARARGAIAAVDPAARVIVGGLIHPAPFLQVMLVARPSLRGHIDGVAIHPYGGDPGAVLAAVRSARAELRSLGIGDAPLYVTEFGWTTRPAGSLDYAPARLRTGYISRSLAALGRSGCGLAAIVLYTWITPERDAHDSQDWFGIAPPRGGQSADVQAFAQGLRAARAPGPRAAAC
jgi:hypothetical protein